MKEEARRKSGRRMWRWKRSILATVLLLILLAISHREVAFLFRSDPRLVADVTENFNYGVVQRPEALENHGCVAGPNGWELPPHTRGRLIYKSPHAIGPQGAAFLSLFLYRPSAEVDNTLKLYSDSERTSVTIVQNVHLVGNRIDLTRSLPSGSTFQLVFEFHNRSSSPVFFLDKMELRIFQDRPPLPPSPLRMTFVFFGLGFAIILFARKWMQRLPLLLILCMGFFIRYVNLERVIYTALDPDAQVYRIYAERIGLFGQNGFYSASFSIREPFFLLVANAFFRIFGPSDTHLRLFTLFLSLVIIVLVYRFAGRLFGFRLGHVAALIMAVNLPFIIESGRGLRLELETALILLLAIVAVFQRSRWPFRSVLLGVLGGLILLTRWSHLPLVSVLILLGSWTAERGWREILQSFSAALALALLLVFPHRYAMYARYGDPFFDVSVLARGFANLEFAGAPGFPSRDEVLRNVFAGPPLSLWEYLLRLHSPSEVFLGISRGTVKIIGKMDQIVYRRRVAALLHVDVGWLDLLLKALGILGIAIALIRPAYRWLPLVLVISLLPVSFLYDRGLLEAYRLTMHAFPFFLAASLLPLCLAGRGLLDGTVRIVECLVLKGKGKG